MSSWPQQKRDISSDRAAKAPYNFVPLPEAVVPAVEDHGGLPDHDLYDKDRHTGHFEVTLTTCSPLYIRAPLTVEEFANEESAEGKDDKPDFFYTRDKETPVIPGSSLRGMLRTLVEIVSYSAVKQVTEEPLFYRTMDSSSLSSHYTDKLSKSDIETGFLQGEPGRYAIAPCKMIRISRNDLKEQFSPPPLYEGRPPNGTPRWNGDCHQWQKMWAYRDGRRISDQSKSGSEWEEGRLVITGDFPGKKKEFLFTLPNSDKDKLPVPDEVIESFHDNNQITQWQEDAFPKDKPEPGCRKRNGMLREKPGCPGDPVFFLREDDEVTFLGRAQMFRMLYENKPADMVPDELQDQDALDYTESLFGYAEKTSASGEDTSAYAGRVSVSSARLEEGQDDIWYSDTSIEPGVLSSPEPTCIQHYLVQDSDHEKELEHYDGDPGEETVIRGHKLYWHRWDEENGSIPQDHEAAETQKTEVKPVDSEVRFSFQIDFENLSAAEVGALCWSLHPQGDPERDYRHKLGMGKPLGLGSVELDATLHLNDRHARYESLFESDGWATGDAGAEVSSNTPRFQTFVTQFEEDVLEKLSARGVDFVEEAERLRDLGRIGILLKMMEWEGPKEDLGYMDLDEFRDRLVLPSPSDYGELTGYIGTKKSSVGSRESLGFGDRQYGTVKWFSVEKGYGFIEPAQECVQPDDDVFVHRSDVAVDRLPEKDDRVTYDVEDTKKGLAAKDVKITGS